jgi:CheY-like chemotaxis protein
MIMPKVTGDVLARELTVIRPDIPIIICTGYPSKITDEKAKVMPIKALLKKPISKQEIAETVRKVLDGNQ